MSRASRSITRLLAVLTSGIVLPPMPEGSGDLPGAPRVGEGAA